MKPRIAALAIAALAGAATPVATTRAQEYIALTPEQIGQIFCLSMLGNDMAAVGGLLTPELAGAIAEAEARNAAWEKANPGEKPPLGDGIPWQDAPDYAATCSVGAVTFMMDEATVKIAHGFPDYPAANFTDTLRLRLVPHAGVNRWRIDDLAYGGEGNLRTALRSAFID